MRLAGLILTGGLSTRYGAEKAVADHNGRPLMAYPTDVLARRCDVVAASVRLGSGAEALAEQWGLPRLYDAPGDPAGPLSGIKAGLIWAEAEGFEAVAVAPCDTPSLPGDLYPRLMKVIGVAEAAFAVTGQGPQPLCSLWRVSSLAAVRAWLTGDRHPPVKRLLASLRAPEVRFEDAAAFANFNTPDG